MKRILVIALALLALTGCAERQALFVVLPNADGTTGAITVDDGKSSVLLDKAYAAAEIRGGAGTAVELKPDEAQTVFAGAIAARPRLPQHFRLYFVLDSDQLVPASETEYTKFFEEVRQREVFEVEVVGHTDTLGTKQRNQELSLRRASAIRDRLLTDPRLKDRKFTISVAGRGQLDPLKPTKDQTAEPENRRVEIWVR